MIDDIQRKNLISLVYDLGKKVEDIKKRDIKHYLKRDNSPLTEADSLVNSELNSFLENTEYKNIISEENKLLDYCVRKKWNFFWVIDPIDGTKEYLKKGSDYTINIALCKKNSPIFSIVFAPARNEFYSAAVNEGSFLNGKKISVSTQKLNLINLVASKSHLSKQTEDFIGDLKKKYKVKVLQYGSSLKICKVAEGKADIYPRFGPTMEWDTCAADLILSQAGGSLLSTDGSKLKYNKQELLNPHFIANSELRFL